MADLPTPPRSDVAAATTGAGGDPSQHQEFDTVKARTQAQTVLRRFLRHRLAMISASVLLLIVLVAVFLPLFWPHQYGNTDAAGYLPPGTDHPLGTDQLGRDMVAQLLRGTQLSLLIAFVVAIGATAIGVTLGALAGYLKGFTDGLVMRLADLMLIIPQIAVAAILVKSAQGSWWVVAVVLAVFFWMQIARITRGETLSLSEREFIEAARASGATTSRVIFRHLVPNMIGSITVNATLVIAQAVLVEAALSFLGLGVQAPDTSLGLIINETYAQLSTRPWLFFAPFVTIVLISLTINFIGDGLRDAFDPRQTKVRA
ncbi:peptide/nickel transport system permease protein [Tamaricihabitans halophyticus]|uniref:Oligopeptide transport system permease protein OppC n=1 Tax=Tamaricihabitans halophyticus TaxID=1262583 RepID=A0A4V2SUW8_9PSEU|nr:ABC transporter permease [Tamaricihabitans halophyticus]TCP56246.1 peptide/nickel transport system permease protein [Tamaricihabitans halophyticus]